MEAKLNKVQKEAVLHDKGPCLVLAGPGSGKTFTIVERTRQLIEKRHVDPDKILVVTFTKAAANEMKERFMEKTGGTRTKVTFGTFHGIFYGIIKWAYKMDASNILSEDVKHMMLKEILLKEQIFPEEEREFLNGIVSEISIVKNNRVLLEDYECKTCGKKEFIRIYNEYERMRKGRRKIDFDDMLVVCHDLFKNRPDILRMWQEKFLYILVDEFQDINKIQYEILKMLAAPQNNLFVVGDDDQSIYQFRGAKPEFILNFEKEYPDAKRYILDVNYRSSKSITDGAARVIMHNQNRYEKSVTTPNPQGMPVHVQEVRDASEEAGYVLGRIQALQQREIPFRTIAVLFRTNSDAGVLVEQLLAHQIPFRMKEKMTNIYDHFAVKDIQSYLRLAMGNKSRTDFLAIMNRPLRYLERGCLDQPEVSFEELRKYYEEKKWMLERIDQLEWDLKMMERMTPYTAIRHIRRRIGYDEYIKEYAGTRKMKAEDVFAVLDEVEERAKAYKTLEEWFTYIEKYRIQLEMIGQQRWQEEEAVSILTMHGAKGLEFDHVFVMEANEDVIPYKKAETKEEMEEERRMFYVAMTRAKKMLVISYVRKKNGKDMYPSRFVEELLGV